LQLLYNYKTGTQAIIFLISPILGGKNWRSEYSFLQIWIETLVFAKTFLHILALRGKDHRCQPHLRP
jgi:RsiW-degrading membrane proteinase PrsW (M82 family)